MDTTDREGDVIITRGDGVTNSRGGGGRKTQREKDRGSLKEERRGQRDSKRFKLNRKTVVISINCTEDWNPV